jgi:alpha-amylase
MKKFSRIFVSLAAAAALIAGAFHATSAARATDVAAPNKVITNASVGMQMFEWNWVSLKSECTNVLGPEGIDWILVSPPQESIQGSQWWVNYQPVSYKLENNLGNRAQFTDMVNACNAAGVEVIVDAVINHMAAAGGNGTGTAGSAFGPYDFPVPGYTRADFHATLSPTDPNYCAPGRSIDYSDDFSITHCELLGLNDLATEKPSVRATIDAYLNDLLSLGVSGFRIDAARHMGITDLTAIQNGLNKTTGNIAPLWLSENTGDNSENIPFAVTGQVFGWSWVADMVSFFGSAGDLSGAQWTNGTYASLNGSTKTVTMVSNHDTERNGSALTYQDGAGKKYLQASIYTVVNQYGLPMLYTGYGFSSNDQGPPSATSKVDNVRCGGTSPASFYNDGIYICMDRWTAIKGAIAWKDAVGTATATIKNGHLGTWSDKYSTFSYKRGSGSFIVFNGGSLPVKNAKIATGLPKGTYCDYISGGTKPLKAKKTCAGTKVVVDAKGVGTFTIPWSGTIALTTKVKF